MARSGQGTAETAADRLRSASREAQTAEARGDWRAASGAWRRYRLIADAQRDPDELLAEGVRLSEMAIELADSA